MEVALAFALLFSRPAPPVAASQPTAIVNARVDESAIQPHDFHPGETFDYCYEDTDTTFAAIPRDGTVVAGDALKVQEIVLRVHIAIAIGGAATPTARTLTLSPESAYREGSGRVVTDIRIRQ